MTNCDWWDILVSELLALTIYRWLAPHSRGFIAMISLSVNRMQCSKEEHPPTIHVTTRWLHQTLIRRHTFKALLIMWIKHTEKTANSSVRPRASYQFVERFGEFLEGDDGLETNELGQAAVFDDPLDWREQFLGAHVGHRLQYADLIEVGAGFGQQRCELLNRLNRKPLTI